MVGIFGLPGEGTGISATGIVTGSYVTGYRGIGLEIGQGSTVIGSTAVGAPGNVGNAVSCPSNVTDNTAINNAAKNLVLNGTGRNNTNNAAP